MGHWIESLVVCDVCGAQDRIKLKLAEAHSLLGSHACSIVRAVPPDWLDRFTISEWWPAAFNFRLCLPETAKVVCPKCWVAAFEIALVKLDRRAEAEDWWAGNKEDHATCIRVLQTAIARAKRG